jgi:KRAB domain-containing zinc finger protein
MKLCIENISAMYSLLDLKFGSIVDEHYHQQHIPLETPPPTHTHTHTHAHALCNLCHRLFFAILYELFNQTDFTASNPKCRRLPERAAQFAHVVSSKHQRMKVHTNAEDMPLICDTCGMTFYQLINFQTHSCIYLGTKHFEQEVCSAELPLKETCKLPVCSDIHSGFQWVVCKDGFSVGSLLKIQILSHSEEDPFKFQACGKSFWYTYKVGNQTGKKSFRCNICGKKFSQCGNLKCHFLTHTGNKSFKCDICGKLFSRSAHAKDHILTHNGVRAFKCDSCDRAFLKLGVPHLYILGRSLSNVMCGKVFSWRGCLTVHHLMHTGESQFKCNICGNAFSQKGHLKCHILTHTGEKHFRCDICGKMYSDSGYIKYHICTHMGEKPFKCSVCSKSFPIKNKLKYHMLVHMQK